VKDADSAELPGGPADSGDPALIADALSIGQVLWFAVATMGVASMLTLSAGALLHVAGYGAWLAVVLGTALILFIAAPIVIFSRRHTVTGSLMSLLGEEFGPRWRPIPGAALLGACILGLMNTSTCAVLYVGSFLGDLGLNVAADRGIQVAVAVITVALAVWLTIRGVSTSMKVTIGLGMTVLPLVLIVCIAAIGRGGVNFGPQLRLEGLTPGALISGTFFALGCFVGFEGFTALGKETRNAARGIPIVLIVVILVISVTLLTGAVMLIPLLMRHAKELDAGSSPNAVLAGIGGVEWTNIPTDALFAAVCVASQVGFTNSAARVVATMGYDGGLPRWVGRIHPARRTPANAACLVGGLVIILGTTHLLVMNEGVLSAIAMQIVLMSNFSLLAYLVTCIGGIEYGLRRATRSIWAAGLSAVGAVGILWALAWRVLHPDDSLSSAAPWIATAWTCLFALVIVYGERSRRIQEMMGSNAEV
jgi:amino acid transporter